MFKVTGIPGRYEEGFLDGKHQNDFEGKVENVCLSLKIQRLP